MLAARILSRFSRRPRQALLCMLCCMGVCSSFYILLGNIATTTNLTLDYRTRLVLTVDHTQNASGITYSTIPVSLPTTTTTATQTLYPHQTTQKTNESTYLTLYIQFDNTTSPGVHKSSNESTFTGKEIKLDEKPEIVTSNVNFQKDDQKWPGQPEILQNLTDNQEGYYQHTLNKVLSERDIIGKKLDRGSPCTRTLRPKDVSPKDGVWQALVTPGSQYFFYSANLDDRPGVGLVPVVRVTGFATKETDQLYCQLWYLGRSKPFVTRTQIVKTGEQRDSGAYNPFLFNCVLPSSNPLPTHVSLSPTKCSQTDVLLQIHVSVRTEWDIEFGVCSPPFYGGMDTSLFIEWIALLKLLGVSEINIYNASTSYHHDHFIHTLTSKGHIQFYQIPVPVSQHPVPSDLLQTVSVNDCLLRNMYRYQYLTTTNIGEVIMPKMHFNYSTLLSYINKREKLSKPWHSYTFRTEFFFFDFGFSDISMDITANLSILSHTRRTVPTPYLFSPISFIDPRQCLSISRNVCWLTFSAPEPPWTVDVYFKIAACHQYKMCDFNIRKCKELFETSQEDMTLIAFRKQLVRAINYIRNMSR